MKTMTREKEYSDKNNGMKSIIKRKNQNSNKFQQHNQLWKVEDKDKKQEKERECVFKE